MSPGSRGRGFDWRKVGSAFSLQPPGPRRPCRRCAWAWRGGSGRGTEPAGGPGVGGLRLGRATSVCLLSTTGVHLNPPSLAVPDETRFFRRRKVTGTGDSPLPSPAFAGRGWQAHRRCRSPANPPQPFPLARYGFRRLPAVSVQTRTAGTRLFWNRFVYFTLWGAPSWNTRPCPVYLCLPRH